ncbi:hypothetical protein Tco_1380326, partial [Tanacetum coccineum]
MSNGSLTGKTKEQRPYVYHAVNDHLIRRHQLNAINSIDSLKATQKSKVRWPIEGDENTKFFHGILNSKCSQLAIRGTFVDGEWIVDPLAVK